MTANRPVTMVGYRIRRRRRGISLVELLVAMLILATGLLAVLSIFPTAFISIYQSKNHLVGYHVAQSYMDAERAKPFTSMQGGTYTDTRTVVVNGVSHQATFTTVVSLNPSANLSDLSKTVITITTQWQQPLYGGGTTARTVTLEAARARGVN